MKVLKFSTQLSLLVLALLVFCTPIGSSVAAQPEVGQTDSAALVKHYENLVKEAETKLQKNKAVLEEYEAHSYYYGRQGQDIKSHTSANIREYEVTLKENLRNADFYRKMAAGQGSLINKAQINPDRDSTVVR
ncbi:MAG: hypothetical protein Q8K59_04395 [Nitrosomonas sp.]|nr:hypothetical protein [Nitrosomonas sp.]MDP1950329.1 hypothetical protein [Nitrosomonas sp.]